MLPLPPFTLLKAEAAQQVRDDVQDTRKLALDGGTLSTGETVESAVAVRDQAEGFRDEAAEILADVQAAAINEGAVVRIVERLAPPMPAGALVDISPLDATTSPATAVPNRRGAAALDPANIFRGTRGQLNRFLNGGNGTISDRAATAHDGTDEAARVVGDGSGYIGRSVTLPAGTYTLSAWVRSATGGSQTFRMGGTASGTAVKTATTTWAQFSHTFTSNGDGQLILPVWAAVGSSGFDLYLDDVRLEPGSTAATTPDKAGHLYWGLDALTTATLPEESSPLGTARLRKTATGLIQFAETVPIEAVSIVAACRFEASDNGYQGIVARIDSTFGTTLGFLNGAPRFFVESGDGGKTEPEFMDFDGRWEVITGTWDGTAVRIYVGGMLVSVHNDGTDAAMRDLIVGRFILNDGGTAFKGTVGPFAVYDRALTDAEVAQARESIRQRLSIAGVSLMPHPYVWAAEGDSITAQPDPAAGSTTGWAGAVGTALKTQGVLGKRWAVGGSTMDSLLARASTVDRMYPEPTPDAGARPAVLTVLIGRNDLLGYSSAQAYADALDAYVQARRAVGWRVVVCTVLPSTVGGFNVKRNALNTILRTWPGLGKCEGICDFGANATMGPDAAAANTSLYYDGTHPTAAGHAALVSQAQAAVEDALGI